MSQAGQSEINGFDKRPGHGSGAFDCQLRNTSANPLFGRLRCCWGDTAGASPGGVHGAPLGHVRCHQRLEQAAVVRNLEVQEFVHDDEVLEGLVLVVEVDREGDRAGSRAGAPFPGHPLDPNDTRHDAQLDHPHIDAPLQPRGWRE